jgi:hypothetical protein
MPVCASGLGKHVMVVARMTESVDALRILLFELHLEEESVGWHIEEEVLQQSGFGLLEVSALLQPHARRFEPISICRALGIPGRKGPEFLAR